MVRKDYNGDGVIEGIQTEVQKLLDKLSTLLPNSTYRANGNYVADGLVKTSISAKTNWPVRFLQGRLELAVRQRRRQQGHPQRPLRRRPAQGLHRRPDRRLQQRRLVGCLADPVLRLSHQSAAAPNAMPAGDGVPNWLKYGLGLNPLMPGISVTNGLSVGVVWANGKSLGDPCPPIPSRSTRPPRWRLTRSPARPTRSRPLRPSAAVGKTWATRSRARVRGLATSPRPARTCSSSTGCTGPGRRGLPRLTITSLAKPLRVRAEGLVRWPGRAGPVGIQKSAKETIPNHVEDSKYIISRLFP